MNRKIVICAACFLALVSAFSFALAQSTSGIPTPDDVGLPKSDLFTVLKNITMWLLGIFGFLAIVSFLISGIMYLTAAGDDSQQERAKNQMIWSIIGVIVGLSGFVVIKAIDTWLKGGSTF